MAIVFVFVDGVGLAPGGADNALSAAPMPFLERLLGGRLVQETAERAESRLLFRPIDATLGVDGLPQSGTGQVAMLAGVNAAALHGRHQPHVPPVALRPLLAEQNVLRRVVDAGGQATFANAFSDGYWQALAARKTRRSASVQATEGAGVRFRTLDDLRAGAAVSWDITNEAMRRFELDVPVVTPTQAGTALAGLAVTNNLVFYENFMPDLAGHGRMERSVAEVFAMIDELLGATVAHLRPGDSLVLTSDHGNIESCAAPTHTRNPVPLLVVGPGAPRFARVRDLTQLAEPLVAEAMQESVV